MQRGSAGRRQGLRAVQFSLETDRPTLVAALAAFAAGYGETVLNASKGRVTGSAAEVPAHATRGNSLTPEFRIDASTGALTTQPGQTVAMSSCMGCWTQCGVRVRVDTASNTILRVAGNPYHPDRQEESLLVRPHQAFSLLQHAGDLTRAGVDYFVVDISQGQLKRECAEVTGLLSGRGTLPEVFSGNYDGILA